MQNSSTGLKKYLTGTTHYIAEYVLMLGALFGLAASAILMMFSICNLLTAGDLAGLSTASGVSSVVAFFVFGGLYYGLSRRVYSEERNNPGVTSHKARSVFYVLASLMAFGWFAGFSITSIYFLISPLAVKGASYSNGFVDVFLPALGAAIVVALSYISIAKVATSRYTAKFTSVALLVGLILAITTLSVAIVKKDQKPTLKSGEKCTYANYSKDKCTYDEYQKYNDDRYPSRYNNTSPINQYNGDTCNGITNCIGGDSSYN